MKIRIYYEDTDAQGIVYHTNYLKFCERARSELFFEKNTNIFSKDSYFVLSQIKADFKKPAILGDIIKVTTKLEELKAASLILRQEIYKISSLKNDSKNELLFSAQIKLAYMKNSKLAKMSEEVKNAFKNISKEEK